MDNEKIKEISKKVILTVLLAGGIAIAFTSPQFGYKMLPQLIRYFSWKVKNKKNKKKIYDIFYQLRRDGLVKMEYRGKQLHISLTGEGKKKAGRYQIDNLKIKKPRKWDKRWRILIFDIQEKQRIKRDALRGKLKELGLFKLQDSVWVCPYNFKNEMEMLRAFFGLTKKEMKIIVASDIEEEIVIKDFFRLK